MKKTRLTVSIVLAAIIIVIAVGGIIFRLNKFKIEFSVPSGETDTVEWGGEYILSSPSSFPVSPSRFRNERSELCSAVGAPR